MAVFVAGCLPTFVATAILPSVGILLTIAIVALSTVKIGANPPDLLFQLLLVVTLLVVLMPNGFIGLIGLIVLFATRYYPIASILSFLSGFILGFVAGLVVSTVFSFITFFIVMTFFYGASL